MTSVSIIRSSEDTGVGFTEFQSILVEWNGTVTGARGRGWLNYQVLGGGTPGQARNIARVQERAGTPVIVGIVDNMPAVLRLDYSRMEPNGDSSYRSPLFSQHGPDHGWAGGDPLYLDTRQIRDLMVKPAGEMDVNVLPGWYDYLTETKYFGGQRGVDLGSYQPPTGTKRGVGIYLTATNTVALVAGAIIARAAAPLPEPAWPSTAFRLGMVILYGQKAFIDFEDVKQRKRVWSSPQVPWSYLVAPDGDPDPALSIDNDGNAAGAGNIAAAGNITAAGELYAAGDAYGLWNRLVNWGFTPDEHWAQNDDQLTWTGWATYTGFATPALEAIASDSIYRTAHSAAAKAFRYRAAATGDSIYLRARLGITQIVTAGLMIDDGANNADGNGANNFFRVYITQSAVGGNVNAVEQYRTGGGAVTTTTTTFTLPPNQFIGLGLRGFGTLWSNWSGQAFIFGEAGELIRYTTGAAGLTWTPARVGLYAEFFASSGIRKAMWDWYDEGVA